MKIYARQGDQVFVEIPQPDGSFESVRDHVIAGSDGSQHVIVGPARIRRADEYTVVVLYTDTECVHATRHHPIALPAGSYLVYTQRERNGQNDRSLED